MRPDREDDAPAGPAPPSSLTKALRHLLRPLVRLLVEKGVSYPLFAELLKQVYVEVALREFPLAGKRQTDSRLSLLTGIHRKDVRRLRREASEPHRPPASVSLGAQIVARWTGVPEFLDAEGRPRPLGRASEPGAGPSFEDLVTSVSKDIRARSVLDEWLRLGVAYLDPEDRVCLEAEAFVPSRGFHEKTYYLGRNLHDHVAAAAHNVLDGTPPLLERSVYYGGLAAESVAELSKLATRAGMEGIQAVNRRAIELQKRDAGKHSAHLRMSFGIYFYQADTSHETDGSSEDPDAR